MPRPVQPADEDVCGSGDGEGSPGGHGADEAADADILPDLRPVFSCRLADRGYQVLCGAADRCNPVPFRGVPVPLGAGLRLGGRLVQQSLATRVWLRRAGIQAGGPGMATLRGQVQGLSEGNKGSADVIEVISIRRGPGMSCRSCGGPRLTRGWTGRIGARTRLNAVCG